LQIGSGVNWLAELQQLLIVAANTAANIMLGDIAMIRTEYMRTSARLV
jgi:hypothetical protein